MKISLIILTSILLAIVFVSCESQESVESKKIKSLLNEKIAQAEEAQQSQDLLKARSLYKEIFTELIDLKDIEKVKAKIEELNMKILFSKALDEDSLLYEVKKGDSLDKIAKKFSTTIELIKKANGLSSDTIRVKDRLKVTKARFSVVIDKSQNLLFLKKSDEVFKTYVVSTGANNSTPVGSFKIINRVKNPVWFRKDIGAVVPPDSPKNILGSCWLGFNTPGYGIHGTTEPEHLGKQITEGCVRMRNEEIEELFTILPRGTQVTIFD